MDHESQKNLIHFYLTIDTIREELNRLQLQADDMTLGDNSGGKLVSLYRAACAGAAETRKCLLRNDLRITGVEPNERYQAILEKAGRGDTDYPPAAAR